jgi:hypothetical protein
MGTIPGWTDKEVRGRGRGRGSVGRRRTRVRPREPGRVPKGAGSGTEGGVVWEGGWG